MNVHETLKKIELHFKNLSVDEFEENLLVCGYNFSGNDNIKMVTLDEFNEINELQYNQYSKSRINLGNLGHKSKFSEYPFLAHEVA